jgi:nitronate monooxygenase
VLRNSFVDRWHGHEVELAEHLEQARSEYQIGVAAEDYRVANLIVGEGIGQIRHIESAADIIHSMVAQAAAINPAYQGVSTCH